MPQYKTTQQQIAKLKFKTITGHIIPSLKFDENDAKQYGVQFKQRVSTPKGMATVLGKWGNMLWFKADNDAGISFWDKIDDNVENYPGFTVKTDFFSEEEMQKMLDDISVSVPEYLNEVKATYSERVFKTINGHTIPLKFDAADEKKHCMQLGQRIKTPNGMATILGVHDDKLWLKLDKDPGVTHWPTIQKLIEKKPAEYSLTTDFVSKEQMQTILRDITVPVPKYISKTKAKLSELEFKTTSGKYIQLNDLQIEEKYGVQFGQRISTPKGMATVLGEYDNELWFKLDNHPGILWTDIKGKIETQSRFSVTPDFISEEELNKITFNSKLCLAIKNNDLDRIDAFLNSATMSTDEIDRAIYSAIKNNNLIAVEKICEKLGLNKTQQIFATTYKYIPDGTHLHTAEQMKNPRMLKMLVQYGANPYLKNAAGITALEVAKSRYFNKECSSALTSNLVIMSLEKNEQDRQVASKYHDLAANKLKKKTRFTIEEYYDITSQVLQGSFYMAEFLIFLHKSNLAPKQIDYKEIASEVNKKLINMELREKLNNPILEKTSSIEEIADLDLLPKVLTKKKSDKHDIEEFDPIIIQHTSNKTRLTNEEYTKLITLVKQGNHYAAQLLADIHANNLAPEAVCSKETAEHLYTQLKNDHDDDYAAVELDFCKKEITVQTLKHAQMVVSNDTRYQKAMRKWISHVAQNKAYPEAIREEAEKILTETEDKQQQMEKRIIEDKLQIRITENKTPTLEKELLKLAHLIVNGLDISTLNDLQLLEMLANFVLTDASTKKLPNNQRSTLIHALITSLTKQIHTIKDEVTRIRLDVIILSLVEAQQYLAELTISSIQKSLAQLTPSSKEIQSTDSTPEEILFPDLPIPALPAPKVSATGLFSYRQSLTLFDELINTSNNCSQQPLKPTDMKEPKTATTEPEVAKAEIKTADKQTTPDLYKQVETLFVFNQKLEQPPKIRETEQPIERIALIS